MKTEQRDTWMMLLEQAACVELNGATTGTATLIVNQGGIQNRSVPAEIKQPFGKAWRADRPDAARKMNRIVCHVAENKLRRIEFKWP